MRAVFLVLALAAMVTLLLNRGGGAPVVGIGDGSYRRLELRPVRPLPEPTSEKVMILIPDKASGDWELVADEADFTPVKPLEQHFDPDQDEQGQRIPGVYLRGERRHALVRGEFDPKTFNQVVVWVGVFAGQPEPVRVSFEVEGREALAGPWLSVPSARMGFGTPLVISFPHARRTGVKLDAIKVEFKGIESRSRQEASTISRIELVHTDLQAYLPASDAPGLVTVAGEERRGVGLSTRAPLTTEFEVPEDGELAFSYGLDERLRVYGEQPRLSLVLESDGEELLSERYDLESAKSQRASWHDDRHELGEHAGRTVRATWTLEANGDHEAFAVVAEPALSVRGEDATTVVLITSDTHRGDHMSIVGGPVQTPVLDALARSGVMYENTYASTNVTNPSHVALMTATSPRDTHILNNTTQLIDEADTLAERFADAGYRTYAAVSAFHLLHEESGLGQGFDRVNGPKKGERDGADTLDVLDEWMVEAAGQPLFVWLHLFDAHAPYQPKAHFAKRYWDGGNPYDADAEPDLPPIELPPFMKGLKDKDYPHAMYRGEVDYVDQLMGRLLKTPRIANGVLAFTADHGESFGEHGVWWDHAELFPETVQVPLILRWPGGPAGVRTDVPVEQLDLGRTLLNLVGIEAPDFRGRDLSWAFDKPEAVNPRYSIAAHGFVASLQSGDWLMHLHLRRHQEWALERPREAHEVELYHLAQDPGCLTNLAMVPEHFTRAQRMRENVIRWVNSADPDGLGIRKIGTLEGQKGLEAMGYGGGDDVGAASFVSDPENDWDSYFEPQ